MNKKTIYTGAAVFLALALAACDMAGLDPQRGSGGKAAVQVIIGFRGPQSRTVAPEVELATTDWQLLGGKSGAGETLLAEFSSAGGRRVTLISGLGVLPFQAIKTASLFSAGA
jgi:hypothetical protein